MSRKTFTEDLFEPLSKSQPYHNPKTIQSSVPEGLVHASAAYEY